MNAPSAADAGGPLSPAITVQGLQQEVHSWATETFGPDREDAAWKKLFEEIGETLKNPEDPSEWGDVFIMLFDLASMHGVDVGTATRDKLGVIRNRVWKRTPTGTFQHVPGAEKTAPIETFRAVFEGGPLSGGGPLMLPGAAPEEYKPIDHEGPGVYFYLRTDRGMDRRPVHYYTWVPF